MHTDATLGVESNRQANSKLGAARGYHAHWAARFLARLKRFRLLGSGAFGRVFMVRDSRSGASAALKLF